MVQADFDNVQPLLASKEIEGSRVSCVFRCPVSGDTYSSTGNMERSGETQGSGLGSSVKRGIKYELSYGLSRVLRNVFGYNPISNIAARAAGEAVRNVQTFASYSEDDQRKAIVQAFNKVVHRFAWDAKRGAWVSASAHEAGQSEFEKRLARAPFNNRFDAEVMARILVQMSRIDGSMSQEERNLLADFLPPDLSLNALIEMPPLNQAELMEISTGPARENMLMMAWAMLFADYEVDPAEVAFLEQLTASMNIAAGQAEALKGLALEFMVSQMFEQVAAHLMTREDVFAKAEELGMERLQVERLEVRLRKARLG